jgi:hypothetical protein
MKQLYQYLSTSWQLWLANANAIQTMTDSSVPTSELVHQYSVFRNKKVYIFCLQNIELNRIKKIAQHINRDEKEEEK